jgi:thioredoxin 1
MVYIRSSGSAALVALLCVFAAIGAQGAGRDIYPEPAQAKNDLSAALAAAAVTHKRVIVDFGGNWCTDCHVLDAYFHDPANAPLLEAGFILVHVNVGRLDENLDIAKHYGVPLRKGVPALAILGERGEVLYSQRRGEFEGMRGMQSSAVTEFLQRWTPASP